MKEKVNVKAAAVVVLSAILGVYIIFFEEQILAGILVIAGGVGLNFLEFLTWLKELISLFKTSHEEENNLLQTTPIQSPQVKAGDNNNIQVTYIIPAKEDIKKDFKAPQLIEEINADLGKREFSDILLKCIRLAELTGSKEDLFWLENEAHGFERNKKNIKEKDIPDYRRIDTEIRVQGKNETDYTPLPYKLTLGQPIWQIEEWIKELDPNSESAIKSQVSESLRKVHKEIFGVDPSQKEIYYFFKSSELKKVVNSLKIRISKFLNSLEKKH